MRFAIPAALAVILLSGCTAAAPAGDAPSGSPVPSSPTASSPAVDPSGAPSTSATPTPTVPPPSLPDDADWTLMSAGLERGGAQVAFEAAANGATMVASVLTEDTVDDFDAGLVFSTDAGETWQWGGVVADKGRTFPEGVLLEADEAVIVGSNQVTDGDVIVTRAFMARAAAPGFVPEAVDLPAEFDGVGVQLQDIISVDGEWVVAGYIEGAADDDGKMHPSSALWRSTDRGETWTKQAIDVPAGKDASINQLVVAPDGSWNAVGQVTSGDIFAQYDAMWLRSTDQGRTFERMAKTALTTDFDQGATRIVFSADGSAAMLGWTEVSEDHGQDSALWIDVAGHGMSQVGTAGVPVKDENPSGMFIDGIMWSDEALVAWGSEDSSYPMPDAQFWYLTGGELVPVSILPGNGTPLDVTSILTVEDQMLGFGFTGADLAQVDVGVWKAPLAG